MEVKRSNFSWSSNIINLIYANKRCKNNIWFLLSSKSNFQKYAPHCWQKYEKNNSYTKISNKYENRPTIDKYLNE